jgi:hypothetical protein
MQLGTGLTQNHCARCESKLTVPAVYRDHLWWHRHCWETGELQLAKANQIIRQMHDLKPPIVFLVPGTAA